MNEKLKLAIKIIFFSCIFTALFYQLQILYEKSYPTKTKSYVVKIKNKESDFEEIENFEHMLLNLISNKYKTDEEEKWSYKYNAPKNKELFSESLRNPVKFYKLKNSGIFNEKSLRTIDMLIYKSLKAYNGKNIKVISFEYKGEEIKFPID